MELQINSLETKIEKMQGMFNKDLKEIKKSQLKMNNSINEIKNTLEGINTRIPKVHYRHSNLNKMKRQRNTQQVKEHEKCPPSQTKEEEIGKQPEKNLE